MQQHTMNRGRAPAYLEALHPSDVCALPGLLQLCHAALQPARVPRRLAVKTGTEARIAQLYPMQQRQARGSWVLVAGLFLLQALLPRSKGAARQASCGMHARL